MYDQLPVLSRILTWSEPELYTDYCGVIYVPSVITDSTPQPTVTDFNTALSIISPSHQSHISVSTVYGEKNQYWQNIVGTTILQGTVYVHVNTVNAAHSYHARMYVCMLGKMVLDCLAFIARNTTIISNTKSFVPMQTTPASSEWPQLWMLSPLLGQSNRLASVPVQTTSSSTIFPVPWPKEADSVNEIAAKI